jgi:hypothetical protein
MIALGKHIENNKRPIRAMMQVRKAEEQKRKRKRGKEGRGKGAIHDTPETARDRQRHVKR